MIYVWCCCFAGCAAVNNGACVCDVLRLLISLSRRRHSNDLLVFVAFYSSVPVLAAQKFLYFYSYIQCGCLPIQTEVHSLLHRDARRMKEAERGDSFFAR